MKLLYKSGDVVTTEIYADYKTRNVSIINHTNDCLERAFGIKEDPSFEDLEEFLESRCFPRTRDRMRWHLDALGLDSYEPLEIIKKTQGKMAGDFNSLEIVEDLDGR